jgi:glycosyltransferase involved in cell wall biosynthesis
VAIVLTVFNDGTTLGETVASINTETSGFELVLVDDGSTDAATLGFLTKLEQDGVRVIHQSNQGQAAAAMTGVRATSARYVLRFDADDLLVAGAVSALADALDRDPTAAAAWGDIETFGLTNFRVPSVPALDSWYVGFLNLIPASALYRRSTLLEVGGWQLKDGFEDWDVWMALAERGHRGVYVPTVAYRYRRSSGSKMMRWTRDFDKYYDALRARHQRLFAERVANRRASPAPRTLKLLVSMFERMPFLSRLQKVHIAQLLTHLIWNGGPVATAQIVRQGVRIRRAQRGLA